MTLGIVGWPLGYSLSPKMHLAALKAAGLPGEYREYKVRPEELEEWLKTAAPRLDGFNVTMPHKEAVAAWLTTARRAPKGGARVSLRAVNTVAVKEGRLTGYNTDGAGFLAPLEELSGSVRFEDRRAVLLGAGGAAQGIADALSNVLKVGRLTVWNRHIGRAEDLVKRVNVLRPEVAQAVPEMNLLPLEDADLIVNATSLGMEGQPELPEGLLRRLSRGQIVYEIVYEPRQTALVRRARERGCRVITGDEMLAAQGAASFEIWTGMPAAKALPAMKRALNEHFAARG